MAAPARSATGVPPSAWWLVLCLVGLDYFSTLAYIPSISVEAAGPLAPFAACLVVFVTLFMALPVYAFVVGRSPHGTGATGLLEQTIPGWRGKLLMLALMGFVATDFVITRSLSLADAAHHVLLNPEWHHTVNRLAPERAIVESWSGPYVWSLLRPYWTRQMGLTILLSLFTFVMLWWLERGITRRVLWLAAVVVVVYMLLSGIIIASGLVRIATHPSLIEAWRERVDHVGAGALSRTGAGDAGWVSLVAILWAFPQMALCISGFELSMTLAPIVRGDPDDDPDVPAGRIRNTRKMLLFASLIMAFYVLGSVIVTTLLVPERALGPGGPARHRTLAYLAHGGETAEGGPAALQNPWFGDAFGTMYDVSTVVILCLAGASVMIGLRDLVPQYLHRLGMELNWAHRFGLMVHLLNAIGLVVTVVFQASVSAQQWAYATSVLVLLAGGSFAATADLGRRCWEGRPFRNIARVPFRLICGFFVVMAGLILFINRSGFVIAFGFVAAILATSFVSRWLRSVELRFEGFAFADEATRKRWGEFGEMDFQVLVPHRPGRYSLAQKDADIRRRHRIASEVPVIFVEVEMGDPSDFSHAPLMQIVRESGLEVIRISRAVSVSHTIAALGLEMARTGRPPEIIFGWSHEMPLAANLNFLLLGEGNVPWMVEALVRKAEPDPLRQPRLIVG